MLVYLAEYLAQFDPGFNVFQYLTLRAILGVLTALIISFMVGPVMIRQPMGKIDLEWVEGDIRIKSSTARIKIRQERGALDLTTTTGSVEVQTNLDCIRDSFVETESGNIHLMIPETSSGQLKIASDMGNIKTEIPISVKSMSKNKLVGEFGTGGVKINLISTTGDVTVAQF